MSLTNAQKRAKLVDWIMAGVRKPDGSVNASGSVKCFAAGTTTPQAIWKTRDKVNSEWLNDIVVLDPNGRPNVAAPNGVFGDGNYRFDVYDSGNTFLYTVDQDQHQIEVVNVQDFGAVGDGVTDDSDAFQEAINYLLRRTATIGGGAATPPATPRLYVPAPKTTGGSYLFKKSVKICASNAGPGLPPTGASPYLKVALEIYGEHRQFSGSGDLGPAIQMASLQNKVPAFCIQGARGVSIVNISFRGQNDFSSATYDQLLTDSTFVTTTARNTLQSPYAAVVVDPWQNGAPTDGGYPGQNGFADDYGYNGPNMYVDGTASSCVTFQGCTFEKFVVGVIFGPTGNTSNCDNIYIRDCEFQYNRVAIAVCGSQQRNMVIENVNAGWQQFFVTNRIYGNGGLNFPGTLPYIHKANIGATKYIFDVYCTAGLLDVSSMYVESTYSIGYVGAGANASTSCAHFAGCQFTFYKRNPISPQVGTGKQIDFHCWNYAPMQFTGCSFVSGDNAGNPNTVLPVMFFNQAPVTFKDCTFLNSSVGPGTDATVKNSFAVAFLTPALVRFENSRFVDSSMASGFAEMTTEYPMVDASGNSLVRRQPLASPDFLVQGTVLRPLGTKFKPIPMGTAVLAYNVDSTHEGEAIFTPTNTSVLNVGDVVYIASGSPNYYLPEWYDDTGAAASSPANGTFAGVISAISGGNVTLKYVPNSLWPKVGAALSFALEVRYFARYHDPGYGTYAAGSTNITALSFMSALGIWKPNDRIDHIAPSPVIPVGTYVTAVVASQITVSVVAGGSMANALLLNANTITTGGASFYKTSPGGTVTVNSHTVVFLGAFTPAPAYRSIVGAYVTIPPLGAFNSSGGLRVTYDDGTVKGPAHSGDYNTPGAFDTTGGTTAVTFVRESPAWTAALARDGAAIVKMEFYLRNATLNNDVNINPGAFVIDGEQY